MFRFILGAAVPALVLVGATLLLERTGGLPTTAHQPLLSGKPLYEWQLLAVLWWLAFAAFLSGLLRPPSRKRFASDVASVMLFSAAALGIIAFVFDMRPTALLTSGIIAVTLGLAFQSVLADLLAGIALNVEAPFRVGDRITLGGETSGRVLQSNWRSVHVHVPDEGLLVVPNQIVAKQRLVNHTRAQLPIRGCVQLNVLDEHDPRTVITLLKTAAIATDGVLDSPAPDVRIAGWHKRRIMYELRFYSTTYSQSEQLRPRVFAQAWEQLALGRLPLEDLLRNIEIFAPLSTEELRSLGSRVISRRYDAGEMVVAEGQSGDSMFVVREGALQVLLRHDRGRQELARLGAGDCFGEMSLLTSAPRSATVRTLSDCVLFEIPKAALAPLISARPDVMRTLGRILAERSDAIASARADACAAPSTSIIGQLTQMIHACFPRSGA